MARRKGKKTRRHPSAHPRGVIQATASGCAFVQTAEGEFFIPPKMVGGAFDGDLVEVAPVSSPGGASDKGHSSNRPGDKPAARVVQVVMRAHDTLVGRYEIAEPFGVVIPEDSRIPYDIFTMRSEAPYVNDGDIVRVRMTEYPSRHAAATGVVEEVVGHAGDAGLGVEMIIAHHKLETRFDERCLQEADRALVDADAALHAGYIDMRDRFTFTIDPVDARDFDDALSWQPMGEGAFRLGIHIADVAHYVAWGSSLDLDARRRATSTYLVDRVIPMLPEALSGDVCSLVPGQTRRSMTVDLIIDSHGAVIDREFCNALISSDARLSYDQADAILQRADDPKGWRAAASAARACRQPVSAEALDDDACARLFEVLPAIRCFSEQRAERRRLAGGIDFKAVEAKVELDETGEAVGVALRTKTPATMCVEEAMIAANENVAAALVDAGLPALFRVHEPPTADALGELIPILQELGLIRFIDADAFCAGDPRQLQTVLKHVEGRPEEELVSSLLVRSMQRAVYRPTCDGHYGLALDRYCHFTSPIRRYPDLVVHRSLKALIAGKHSLPADQKDALGWLAEHSSAMERVAEAAARESQELKLVEYMKQFVGQTFSGIVSGVATYGMYVRLENTAEGLVPMRALGPEYFALDPRLHTLTGQSSGAVHRLGQRIDVRLDSADPTRRQLTFSCFSGKTER